MTTNMQGKVVLITGGNTGIGKATAIALAKLGAQVTITSRSPEKGQAALAQIHRESGSDAVQCLRLDLASLAGVRSFAAEFTAEHSRLDVLINNAGLMLSERTETLDGFETTFGVNHLGHFVLTHELLPLLRRSAPARIVVLSSDAHRGAPGGLNFDDLQTRGKYRGFPVYCRSKLANLLFTLELADRLRGIGVTVNAVHPGFVNSEFAGSEDTGGVIQFGMRLLRWAMITPEQGARTSVYLASSAEVAEVSGRYFVRRKQVRPSRAALDRGAALRLWEVSEQLTAPA